MKPILLKTGNRNILIPFQALEKCSFTILKLLSEHHLVSRNIIMLTKDLSI